MKGTRSQQLTADLIGPESIQQLHLDTLLQVSRAIGSVLELDELLRQIIEQITPALGADRSTLFLHDAKRKQLFSRLAQGLEDWPREFRIADDAGIAGRVFQSHTPLLIRDTFDFDLFARDVAEQTGYVPRSMMVVPILQRATAAAFEAALEVASDKGSNASQCIGVLQVMDVEVNAFNEADLALLEAIAVQVGISLDNARLYEAQKRQFESFIKAFSAALDARDPSTALHSVNVANFAMGIAHELGLPRHEIDWLRVAGLLHDVGKIGTPESILTKPGKLDDDEYVKMKEHAAHSRRILQQIEFTSDYNHIAEIAAAHHEKLDGSGYPDGLRGEALPLKARILCVADIFDALTQDRHYRKGMPLKKAFSILDDMTPAQLDAECVAALKRFMGFAR